VDARGYPSICEFGNETSPPSSMSPNRHMVLTYVEAAANQLRRQELEQPARDCLLEPLCTRRWGGGHSRHSKQTQSLYACAGFLGDFEVLQEFL